MSRPDRSTCRRLRPAVASSLILAALAASGAAQEPDRPITVSYLSGSSVYVDAGRAQGLAAGARLVVVRGGETVADLEVVFVADHSASCRVVSQTRTLQLGDVALPVAPADGARAADEPTTPALPRPSPAPSPTVAAPVSRTPPRPVERAATHVSGSLSLRWQGFRDGSGGGRDVDELTSRVSLRARDLGGLPLELRLRARGRQIDRAGRSGGSASERSDRFYELSLRWAPPGGRLELLAGRLGASPFVGLGYLDGVLADVRLGERVSVGGFFGSRSDVEELGLGSTGQKYGAFVRFGSAPRPGSRRYSEIVLAGVGEYLGGDPSREYVSFDGRFGSGSRWSLFQHLEIDLNRDWRELLADKSYQLSNLTTSLSYRLSASRRLTLSYDQNQRYRTAETRELPEEAFDDLLRQGYRGSFYFGGGSGFRGSVFAGLRQREGGGDSTVSYGGSLYHAGSGRRGLLLGGEASGYSGASVDGLLVNLKARMSFAGGGDVGLTLGASMTTVTSPASIVTPTVAKEERGNQWLRLSGNYRLGRRLLIYGELELDAGDDLEGQRLILELVYRL